MSTAPYAPFTPQPPVPQPPAPKRPWFKRKRVVIPAILLAGAVIGGTQGTSTDPGPKPATTYTQPADKPAAATTKPAPKVENIPAEHSAALKQAQSYNDLMHFSKKGLYEQLTSSAGAGFPKDAAQYAVDNVNADWKANALAKAESYRETMSMSNADIKHQLLSDVEGFTQDEVAYAMKNLGK